MELSKLLEEARIEEEKLSWEGTFAQYLEMAIKNPAVARLSHARIYDMILATGVEDGEIGPPKYKLFSAELFGLDKALQQIVEYFGSAGRRLEVRKRILLLVGPVASGKSTLVDLLKKGLEEYTRTDAGALYAIKGCPMQEEPLHLIPHKLRPILQEEHGLYIEGDLCPHCRYMLRSQYQGKIEEVGVQRVALSEKDGIGIGTFVATDPASQELARLIGDVDLSAITTDRVESAGRAYRLDGELNVANRGIMEFIEMLKSDEKFLTVLLTLTQEQHIKTDRFGMVYADEAIISHTNEAEYNAFVQNKKAEALQDRIIVARIPYNLRVSDEVRIYEKLLRESNLEGIHLAPLTLGIASTFTVLSRLEPSKKLGMTPMRKLKLYDGQFVEGYGPKDVEEMEEEAVREGMNGISPRYVINRLSSAIAKSKAACIDPVSTLEALWDGLEERTGFTKAERERLLPLFTDTRREYDERAKKEVQKALVDPFDQTAAALVRDYVNNVETFCTGREAEADERLMRSIEEGVGIREVGKRAFREEIRNRANRLAQVGRAFGYDSDPRLKEAIEKRLLPDAKEVAKLLGANGTPNADQLRKRDEVVDRLVQHQGYCSVCARGLVEYVVRLLGAGERGRGVPRRLRWLWG